MKIHNFLFLGLSFALTSFAQTPPQNFTYAEESHILSTGGAVVSDFYDEAVLADIYLEFNQADYWQMLHDATATDTYVMGKMTYGDKVLDSVGVSFKGNTSYSKITEEDKLSFAISLNEFVDGQDIEGYNTLNLNNAYQDYTFMREVFYLHQNRKNIPAAQGNFVKVYLNGEYWGIYCNVQQLNKDFTKEWFMTNNGSLWRANPTTTTTTTKSVTQVVGERPGGGGNAKWGDGTSALNYLGEDTALFQERYTLKSSDQEQPWDLLVKVTDILNNTSDEQLLDSLSQYLSIDRTLWFLAHEIAFSDDDSYIYKGRQDYYVYYEPETGLFVPLEFDGNSVMNPNNVSWGVFKNTDNVNYPLMNRLFGIPELRQRYLAHFRTVVNELFDAEGSDAILDTYYSLITADVKTDTKKLFTNAQYESAFLELKDFISDRRAFLWSNTELNVTPLAITSVTSYVGEVEFANPDADESVAVTTAVSGDLGVAAVYLYYATGYVGNFTKVAMTDNGDGTYSSEIPAFEAGEYVRYYVEAVASNAAMTASYSPVGAEHDVYFYRVNMVDEASSDLVINEVMASNKSTMADENGKYEDWIELYNNGSESVSMVGYYLTDDATELTKWAFPAVTIAANDFLTLWTDADDEEGELHTNFKLSSDGEELLLITPAMEIADQVFFTKQYADVSYARLPNGTGDFGSLSPTYGTNNDTYLSIDGIEGIEVLVFPNPVDGVINITAPVAIEGVDIYNIAGQRVGRYVLNGSTLDISSLSQGAYIMYIDLQSMVVTKQFIKM